MKQIYGTRGWNSLFLAFFFSDIQRWQLTFKDRKGEIQSKRAILLQETKLFASQCETALAISPPNILILALVKFI